MKTLQYMACLFCTRQEFAKALPLAREAKEIAHRLGLPSASKRDKLVADLERLAGR